jgi:hypothetical protein
MPFPQDGEMRAQAHVISGITALDELPHLEFIQKPWGPHLRHSASRQST